MSAVGQSVFAALICAAALAQSPRIDGVVPSQGPIAGGTVVTITGSNLGAGAVTIDRRAATPLSQSPGEVRLQMPSHDNGYAIIGVGEANARFLYVPPPLRDLAPGFITTVVGIGLYSGEYGPAVEAGLKPLGMTFDRANTLYFTDPERNRVYRLREGILEPFAGTGVNGGPNTRSGLAAIETPISFPRGIVFDSAGNLYVPDTSYYLWRVTPEGIAEIVAGTGRLNFSGDGGPARQADIGNPSYVVVDRDDNVYFMAWPSFTSVRIRKIDRNGTISTYAGNGTIGFSGDGGPATQAQLDPSFSDFGALALDHDDNLYVIDDSNRRIRRIDRASGIITTIVGPLVNGFLEGIAFSPSGELHFADKAHLFRRSPSGTLTELTTGRPGFSEDGSLLSEAALNPIAALAFDRNGTLYFTEWGARRVRKVDEEGRIRTVAGIGPRSFGEGGPATAAALLTVNTDLDVLPTGELAMTNSDRLVKIDRDGNLVRFAGTGLGGPLENLPATEASMTPASMNVNRDGTIDFATGTIGMVARIDKAGFTRRIAGKWGGCVLQGDGGKALEATFCQPWDALADADGNLFVADTNNNRVRRVDAGTGIIDTFAGSGPTNGLERFGSGTTCGDGGPATAACINTPYGLALDNAGNLYVEENEQRIRKITPGGTISTLAVVQGTKVTWAFGNLYTLHGGELSRVTPAGEVTHLTADGQGFSGDGGPADRAHVFANKQSHGIAVDGEGNLFFGDGDNWRIRAIRYGALLAPPDSRLELSREGSSMKATVVDVHGHGEAGVRVEFSAPASGASCSLSSSFAITDASGAASVTCTPNCIAGTYTVRVQMLNGPAPVTATITNAARPCRRRSVRQ